MLTDIRTLAIALIVITAFLAIGFQMPGDLFVDFGPNDRLYAHGFRGDFENDEPTIIHWTTDRSVIQLPFYLRGPFEFTLRYKRHIAAPAAVRLYRNGELLESFSAPQQDFALYRTRIPEMGPSLARFEILTQSEDPRPLGIALDWMRLVPSSRKSTILPRGTLWFGIWIWLSTIYLAARSSLETRRAAVAVTLGAGGAMLASVLVHKLWLGHVIGLLSWRPLVLAWIAIALVRLCKLRNKKPESIWAERATRIALLVVFLATIFRLALLFHPDFYYPDVRTQSKFVYAIWSEGLGGFLTNHIENQHRHLLGLQLVGGKWLAFPYPPVLYLLVYPFSKIQLPVEEWMTLLMTTVAAAESVLMIGLARRLGLSSRAGALAAILHASARLVAFRLAVASYAALFGHFIDSLVVFYVLALGHRLKEKKIGAGLAGLVFLSLMSYAGSALVLGLFLPFLAAWLLVFGSSSTRAAGRPLLAWSAIGAATAILLFYVQYIPELAPSGDESHDARDLVSLSLTPLAAVGMALHRLRLFFGLGFAVLLGALALTAYPRIRTSRAMSELSIPLAAASLFTFAGLNFLRAGLGDTHIFQFTKDVLVILPLSCLLLGSFVHHLWGRPWGRIPAAMILIAWIGWGVDAFANDIGRRFIRPDYPPPAMEPELRVKVRGFQISEDLRHTDRSARNEKTNTIPQTAASPCQPKMSDPVPNRHA